MLNLPTVYYAVLLLGEDHAELAGPLRAEGRTVDLQPKPGQVYDAVVLLDRQTPFATTVRCLASTGRLLWRGEAAQAETLADAGLRSYEDPGLPQDGWHAAVRERYEPLDHAVALRDAGRADWAAEVLAGVPETYYPDPRQQVRARILHMRCLLECAREEGDPTLSLALFFRAQKAFFLAVYVDPLAHEAYQVQAAFWSLLGRPDRAAALLRSIQHAAPDDVCAAALDALGAPDPPTVHDAPPIDFPRRSPRILALVLPGYDPGMDILYDGLCTVIGADQVIEYPWKPLLHGRRHEEADGYPTTFNHPGEARDLDWVCAELAAGGFDFILYADLLKTLPREALQRILHSAGDTPLFVVDGWDDASNNLPILLAHLDVSEARVKGYFKREMIAGVDYGPQTIPLPLSYPDGRVPVAVSQHRTQALFWAGNRYYGLRRLYLEHLEAATGLRFDQKYAQDEYIHALQNALIGISFCGFGFDTIRYWEVPAHGGVLLAEQTPLRIPHDFTDLENAVFFRDLPEFIEKLGWCLRHPEALPRIAAAGHRHFLAHHTASARARQLLAHMEDRLGKLPGHDAG